VYNNYNEAVLDGVFLLPDFEAERIKTEKLKKMQKELVKKRGEKIGD